MLSFMNAIALFSIGVIGAMAETHTVVFTNNCKGGTVRIGYHHPT
jgi:hypothetical protein